MFSRFDIEKEIGKGINIYPFHEQNIKENSINLTLSHNAWAMTDGIIVKDKNKSWIKTTRKEGEPEDSVINIKRGEKSIIKLSGKDYVVFLPHQTTNIETSEVLAVSNYIGGTLHSKVGLVCKGLGHIGTMLGPNYCGHLLVAIHNITDYSIILPVGETFVSIAFYRLDRISGNHNSNISGHIDKLSELKIHLDESTRNYLLEDWKTSIESVREKLCDSKEYKDFKKRLIKRKIKSIMNYINLKNIIVSICMCLIIIGLYFFAAYLDKIENTSIWSDRYWTIFITGILIPIFSLIINIFKRN